MPFPIVALLVTAAFSIAAQLLAPKPKDAKPASFNDLNFPTAREDRPIPLVVGTVLHKSPNVIWYGDYKTSPIKKAVNLFKKAIVGYKYYLGVQLGLSLGVIGAIREIHIDNKTVWTGSVTDGDVVIDDPKMFGDPDQEGGFTARFRFYSGTATQPHDDYVYAKTGGCPAYRNMCHVVLSGLDRNSPAYIGNQSTMREINFVMERFPNVLGQPQYINVNNGDANPAEFLFELLTSDLYGWGKPASLFDIDTFRRAAQTLYNEGIGMSILWDNSQDVETMVQEIEKLTDGILCRNISTGLIEFRLARADYDVDSLDAFNEDNVLEYTYTHNGWSDTINEVKMTFTDRLNSFTERPAQDQDFANVEIQGEVVSHDVDIKGVSTAAQASLIIQRERRVVGTPLAKLQIKVNRQGVEIYPGKVFKWSAPSIGVTQMIMRVTTVDLGAYEAGAITIEAVQDVYALGKASYAPIPQTSWQPNTKIAADVLASRLIEQPYFFSQVANRVMALAARANSQQAFAQLYVGGTNFTKVGENSPFCPTGILMFNYPQQTAARDTTLSFTFAPEQDIDEFVAAQQDDLRRGANLILVDDEWLAIEDLQLNSDGTYTATAVWRGLLDSVPQAHANGARVWFVSYGSILPEDVFQDGQTIHGRVVSGTVDGKVSSVTSAVDLPLTIASRANNPLPPANLQATDTSNVPAGGGISPDFIEDFNAPLDTTSRWFYMDTNTAYSKSLSSSGGRGVCYLSAGGMYGTGYVEIRTQAAYNMVGKAVRAQLVSYDPLSGATESIFGINLGDYQNRYAFGVRGGYLEVNYNNGGMNVETWTSVNYDPTQHKFLQIRHDSTTNRVYFEVSADGSTFVSVRDLSVGFSLSSVYIHLTAGAYANSSPTNIIWDDLQLGTVSASPVPTGQVALTWYERNRLTHGLQVLRQDDPSHAPEAGTTYTVIIHDENDAVVRTVTGLTTPAYNYTAQQELSDTGRSRLAHSLRFEVKAVVGALSSRCNSIKVTRS